ncbi:aspartyl-phosphate phosphatase Spo0E family protein [Cytobacillus sp. IB215665]|uniref:aspartyl-phosphate phosphatase Spo0E family protein n=1 Tax=Cytobacillus sp. IB215665 TaxID=3097357 RepID=UPI002A10A6BB|nr:aspartyl-phosphate phosphatase Spo0E family protein [Cytobacillus sp. IB215665]MDX8365456.1 aspartyl-phosphate phosphatase Spo0E family protein [Cytobacillus sp. IB215665]
MNQLQRTIEQKREEMTRIATREGLTSQKVIRCSQELDQLINHYLIFYKRLS